MAPSMKTKNCITERIVKYSKIINYRNADIQAVFKCFYRVLKIINIHIFYTQVGKNKINIQKKQLFIYFQNYPQEV
jgi:hypothetical protein